MSFAETANLVTQFAETANLVRLAYTPAFHFDLLKKYSSQKI